MCDTECAVLVLSGHLDGCARMWICTDSGNVPDDDDQLLPANTFQCARNDQRVHRVVMHASCMAIAVDENGEIRAWNMRGKRVGHIIDQSGELCDLLSTIVLCDCVSQTH
jgi:hypothetical protein